MNNDAVQGYGVAGGFTKVTIGNGTAHVISAGGSMSTGGTIPAVD